VGALRTNVPFGKITGSRARAREPLNDVIPRSKTKGGDIKNGTIQLEIREYL